MSNSTLSVVHGWDPYQVRAFLSLEEALDIDGDEFRDNVRMLQRGHGLVPDGWIGRKTWGVMRAVFASPTVQDIERLGAIIRAECGSGSLQEQYAVGATVLNRILINPTAYGHDPLEVSQGRHYAVRSRNPDYMPTQRTWNVAEMVLTYDYISQDGRSLAEITHFYSPQNMPRQDSPEWPGKDRAQHRHYYQQNGKYFLWDEHNGRIYTSTKGGWLTIEGLGTVAQPGFAAKMEYVPLIGVDPIRFRFYKHKEK